MGTPLDDLSPRMRQLLDAALVVVSRAGLRGLTHRAVDAEAGLPQGSCSAYLRTRSALQSALGDYVEKRLVIDLEALSARLAETPGDPTCGARETTALFVRWLRDRNLVVARLELALEAVRDPELASVFGAWRVQLVEIVAGVIRLNRAALVGPLRLDPDAEAELVSRHAEASVAALEGVLLAALLKPARQRQAYVATTIETLMEAMTSHGFAASEAASSTASALPTRPR